MPEQARVTQSGAYIEAGGDYPLVTQMGAYIEAGLTQLRATQVGAYIEMVAEPASNIGLQTINFGPKTHLILPDEATGYALDDPTSFWNVVKPEGSTNYVVNPSFENGTYGYTYAGWSGAEVTEAYGAVSGRKVFKATTGGGTCYVRYTLQGLGLYSLPLADWNTHMVFSAYVYVQEGETYYLRVRETVGGAIKTSTRYVARTTGWVRLAHRFFGVLFALDTLCLEMANPTAGKLFLTDAWQLEAKQYVTTYFDGDTHGFQEEAGTLPYRWQGPHHASPSFRSEATASGGRIVSLEEYGFKTTEIAGLGLPQIDIEGWGLRTLNDTIKEFKSQPRVFTVGGRIYGCNPRKLATFRLGMTELFKVKRAGLAMPTRLIYQPVDFAGYFYGFPLVVNCTLVDGLTMRHTNHYQETMSLQFKALDPRIYEDRWVEDHVYIDRKGATVNVLERDNYEWTGLSSGSNVGLVYAVGYGPDGVLYVGGSFTTLNGFVMGRVARYSKYHDQFFELAAAIDGLNNDVYTLCGATQNDTDLLIGGNFTASGDGSVTGLNRIVHWNSDDDDFTVVGSGLNSTVNVIIRGGIGVYYVGGNFTADGGATPYPRICKVTATGSSYGFVALNQGLNAQCLTLLLSRDGRYLYAGGTFTADTSGSPVTMYRVGRYDLVNGVWEALGDGFNSTVETLAFGPDGMLYAGGNFTANGGATRTINRIARWNGYTWEEVGGGLNSDVYTLTLIDKILYVTGTFTGGDSVPDELPSYNIGWNGNRWVRIEFNQKTGGGAYIFESTVDEFSGRIAYAMRNAGATTSTYARTNVITNQGTAEASPVIYFPGLEQRFYSIRNITTGQVIRFNEFTVGLGEECYLDLRGVRPKFYSKSRPDLLAYLDIGGSDLDFTLVPGDNLIQLYGEHVQVSHSDNEADIYFRYQPAHWTIDKAGAYE